MKQVSHLVISIFIFTFEITANNESRQLGQFVDNPRNNESRPKGECNSFAFLSNINIDFEKRGCCSWHNGVCGCYYGRAQCCDGSLSPSCGCD